MPWWGWLITGFGAFWSVIALLIVIAVVMAIAHDD